MDRFSFYRSVNAEDSAVVTKVIDVLNGSWVNEGTAIDLLTAMALCGYEFVIECYGDSDYTADSKLLKQTECFDLSDNSCKFAMEWFIEIAISD